MRLELSRADGVSVAEVVLCESEVWALLGGWQRERVPVRLLGRDVHVDGAAEPEALFTVTVEGDRTHRRGRLRVLPGGAGGLGAGGRPAGPAAKTSTSRLVDLDYEGLIEVSAAGGVRLVDRAGEELDAAIAALVRRLFEAGPLWRGLAWVEVGLVAEWDPAWAGGA